ncbi:MAG: hypothetical protein U0350_49805 [Caldilineaceae bacterium]
MRARTDLEQRLSSLRVGAAYRKRLLPLAWRVLPFGGTSAEVQTALLRPVQPDLPAAAPVRIHDYGDCELRPTKLQAFCRHQHWQWPVGGKSDTYIRYSRLSRCDAPLSFLAKIKIRCVRSKLI